MSGWGDFEFVVTSGSSVLPRRSLVQYSGLVAVSLVPAINSQREHSPCSFQLPPRFQNNYRNSAVTWSRTFNENLLATGEGLHHTANNLKSHF